jgi:transcriptional regulator with XRE-family HTH domain
MAFKDRLKALREAAGLTQEGLARAADMSTSTVAKIENAGVDPAWSTVIRLAHGLGVRADAFEDEQPDASPGKPAKVRKGNGRQAPAKKKRKGRSTP